MSAAGSMASTVLVPVAAVAEEVDNSKKGVSSVLENNDTCVYNSVGRRRPMQHDLSN